MWIFDRTYFNVIYFKRNVFFNLFVLSSVILSSFFCSVMVVDHTHYPRVSSGYFSRLHALSKAVLVIRQ